MSNDELRRLIQAGYRAIGELEFAETPGGYCLYHRRDRNSLAKAKVFRSPEDAREVAKYDRIARYRPLKGAPNLPSGWVIELQNLDALKRALDYFYPGAVATWRAFRETSAPAVSLRQTLSRQTGMYRITQRLSTGQAENLVQNFCSSDGRCLRTILWGIEPGQSPAFLPPQKSDPSVDQTGEGRKVIPYLCLEGCNMLVAAARKVVMSELGNRNRRGS
jgi:4Fe-4S iron-sulfur cluster binding domain/DR2241 stabilising domain